MRNKKIVAIIAIIMVPVIFFAGFLVGAGKMNFIFGGASADQSEIADGKANENDDEAVVFVYVDPDAPNNGSYRTMLGNSVKPVYDALEKHLLDEKRCDNLVFNANEQNAVRLSYRALLEDHPELFWLDEEISDISIFKDTDGMKKISVAFGESYSGAFSDIDKGLTELELIVSQIIAQRQSESRYDTLRAIQDYICDNATYEVNTTDFETSKMLSYMAPLLNCGPNKGHLICGGYSKAFKALCNQFDIPCVIIRGESMDAAHAWNYVRMEDGKWYGVDVTEDDFGDPVKKKYLNFLKGSDSKVLEDGSFYWGYEDITKFGEAHIPSEGSDWSNVAVLSYPVITNEVYQPDTE